MRPVDRYEVQQYGRAVSGYGWAFKISWQKTHFGTIVRMVEHDRAVPELLDKSFPALDRC